MKRNESDTENAEFIEKRASGVVKVGLPDKIFFAIGAAINFVD